MEDYSEEIITKKRVVLKKPESDKDKLERLLKSVKSDYSVYGKISSSKLVYDLQTNRELLEKSGWKLCIANSVHLPTEYLQPFFHSYNDYKSNKPKYIDLNQTRNNISKDEVLDVYFYGRQLNKVFIKDELKNLHYLHVEHLLSTGELKPKVRATRDQYFFCDFDTFYYDNHKSPKDIWQIPTGETFGIEIEMNFSDALSKLKFSKELHDIYPNWFCERDGSLQDYDSNDNGGLGGLELISPPLNFDNLVKESAAICNILKKYNVKAFKAGEFFGLHVTHSIKNHKQGSNYIRYVHSNKLREFWRSVSRRNENKFCKYNNNMCNDLAGFNYDLAYLTKGYNNENHYMATCVRDNKKAIETRIFASTKGPKTLAATLELIKLTNQFSEFDFNVSKYAKFIAENASRNLAGFLKNRGSLGCLEVIDTQESYDDEQESF